MTSTDTIVAICVIVGLFVVIAAVACFFAFCAPTRRSSARAATQVPAGTEAIFYVTLNAPTVVRTIDVAKIRESVHKAHPLMKAADVPPLIAQAIALEIIAQHGRDSVLAYYDDVSKAFVEVDLLVLSQSPTHMNATADVPLCIVHGDDYLKLGGSLGESRKWKSPTSPPGPAAFNDLNAAADDKHRTSITIDGDGGERLHRSNSRRRQSLDRSGALTASPSVVQIVGREILDPPGKRLPLVTPRLYPRDTVILNTRQIYVVANRYVNVSTQQLATLDIDVVQAIDELWLKHTLGGKRRFPAEPRRVTIAKATVRLLADDATAVGQLPAHHGLNIVEVAMAGRHDEVLLVVAVVPARVKLCWSTDGHWEEYEPIALPPGRWCVRAECVNQPGEHHLEPKSSSRVYTVEHEHA